MSTLGDDVAADVFRYLTEEEVQLVGREISKLNKVTPEQAENTLREFHEMSVAQDYLTSGGIEYANRVMNSAFGPDRARLIIDRVRKSLGDEIPPLITLVQISLSGYALHSRLPHILWSADPPAAYVLDHL